jgi:hypothetical protein
VDDIDLPLSNIPREAQLTQDAAKMMETLMNRVNEYRHLRAQAMNQRTFCTEAGDLHIEFGGI